MKITLRFKPPPLSRRKDVVVVLYDGPTLPLDTLKEFWTVEQTIDARAQVRVHLEVEDDR